MEVIIYGLRGGYKVLYNKSKYNDVADDLRSSKSINDEQLLGQSAYSVSFSVGAYVLTKHIIMYDYSRGFSPLNFSIVIPNNQRMDSEYAKSMLDKLESKYSRKYLIDYYNKEENENWSFVEEIKAEYQKKLSRILIDEIDNFSIGKDGPAYLYYDSEDELLDYFKYPYQDEFERYKLVYLIDSKLEGSNINTLNALKHNSSENLTRVIDFSNKVYRLKNFVDKTSRGIEIKVFVNDKERNKNNNRIRLRDTIRIEYSKPYYHIVTEEGSLNELKENKFIVVNEADESININQDITLDPIIKEIKLDIKDWKGKVVSDPIITIRNNEHEKPRQLESSTIKLYAEEVKSTIIISVSENQLEGSLEITPENIQEETISITLQEKKSIKFTIPNVPDDRVTLTSNGKRIRNNIINFKNKDIYELSTIKISSEGYESKSIDITPSGHPAEKSIKLNKKDTYTVDAGEHGSLKNKHYIVYKKDGSDLPPKSIIPNKGYKHIGFTFDNKKGKVIATYTEIIPFYKLRMFLPLSLILLVSLLGAVGAYLYLSNGDRTGPRNTDKEAIVGTVKDTLNVSPIDEPKVDQGVESESETESKPADNSEEKDDTLIEKVEKIDSNSQSAYHLPAEDEPRYDEMEEDKSDSQMNKKEDVIEKTEETKVDTDETDRTKKIMNILNSSDTKETKYNKIKAFVDNVAIKNNEDKVVIFFTENMTDSPTKSGKRNFMAIPDQHIDDVNSLNELKKLLDKVALDDPY